MTQKLYFGGINGSTGAYGLRPMSVVELAERILEDQYATERRVRELRQELSRQSNVSQKLLDMIEILMTDNVRVRSVPCDERDDTFASLGAKLLEVAWSEGSSPGTGEIEVFGQRLRAAPVETVGRLAQLVSRAQSRELVHFLGIGSVEDVSDFHRALESRFDRALVTVQKTYLDSGLSNAASSDAQADFEWVEGFCRMLAQMPVPSLRDAPGTEHVG
ncbi:MAG: hypothetical protein ACP5JG_16385, partial [Anaerolineae bacterium]